MESTNGGFPGSILNDKTYPQKWISLFLLRKGGKMADSNITKKALAKAFKELLKEKPFNKISINAICNGCGMNRKSFYYHFKDKYDLVNWIFETECLNELRDSETLIKDILCKLCMYFYENKSYYSKVFKIEGQNSFNDYFRELVEIGIRERIIEIMGESEGTIFFAEVFTDTIMSTIRHWILRKDPMEPEKFVDMLEKFVDMLEKFVVNCAIYISENNVKGEDRIVF